MDIQTIKAPSGEDMVVLSRRDFQDLIDARDHATAMRDIAAGAMEMLTADEVKAYLAAPTPLAFWRKRRGLTQVALARQVAISQAFLAQIETRDRLGDVHLYARLAHALRVRIEDLVPDMDGGADLSAADLSAADPSAIDPAAPPAQHRQRSKKEKP